MVITWSSLYSRKKTWCIHSHIDCGTGEPIWNLENKSVLALHDTVQTISRWALRAFRTSLKLRLWALCKQSPPTSRARFTIQSWFPTNIYLQFFQTKIFGFSRNLPSIIPSNKTFSNLSVCQFPYDFQSRRYLSRLLWNSQNNKILISHIRGIVSRYWNHSVHITFGKRKKTNLLLLYKWHDTVSQQKKK